MNVSIRKSNYPLLLLSSLILASFFCPHNGDAQSINVEEKYPQQGKMFRVSVSNLAEEDLETALLSVTYRPNSETKVSETISPSTEKGTWFFTPGHAGIVELSVEQPGKPKNKVLVSKPISVRFSKTPISGILVMLFAGFILFGGIIISMKQALTMKVKQ